MHHLAETWRSEATLLRRRGAGAQADALESCATELEEWTRQRDLEALTLDEAAAESGYSYSALQKKVADVELANVGRPRAPRVRRRDLPKKATRPESAHDIADIALAARSRRAG